MTGTDQAVAPGAVRSPRGKLDWTNTLFVSFCHVMAVAAIVYLCTVRFSWWTAGLSLAWFGLCGLSITGGYHRLFSHRAYKAHRLLEVFYLLFGAASVQNSALKWSHDHRAHHAHTDKDRDVYNIRRGFWWAHIGWVFHKDALELDSASCRDLAGDRFVRWQHRYYVPLAILMGLVVPALLGSLWGDAIGAALCAGFLRLVLQWHATFCVNSFAHLYGSQPYSLKNSARDSFWNALLTLGEGYHNFHHRFQADYRNGVRWYHFDPTKWFVWTMSHVGLTHSLRRVPASVVERARSSVREELRVTK